MSSLHSAEMAFNPNFRDGRHQKLSNAIACVADGHELNQATYKTVTSFPAESINRGDLSLGISAKNMGQTAFSIFDKLTTMPFYIFYILY